eukprot:scaffold137014_cov31-Tisochrysis_lutea.AAC.7
MIACSTSAWHKPTLRLRLGDLHNIHVAMPWSAFGLPASIRPDRIQLVASLMEGHSAMARDGHLRRID